MTQRTSERAGPAWAALRSRRGRRAASRTASFRLTIRGALLGLFGLDLLTFLVSAWLHSGVLDGLGFCAGALLAVIVSQALTAQGDSGHGSVMSVIEGTFLTLAAMAPWLFAGTAACLVVASCRGLPQCVRDLSAGLRLEANSGQLSQSESRPG
jgi:hypothetical protein